MKNVSSSLFNFQYGHWRKSRGPHSCRPTTPLQTAACTPTPRAALYQPLTVVPTRARSLSRRNSIPGRSPVGRTAKQRILGPAPRKFSSEGRESYSNGLFLVVFCVPQSPQTSLINLFQWMSTLDSTPEETSARFTRERTLTENGLFYSPSLSDCSSILRPGTRNNKRWFKPKMRQLCNLRTCCFVFVFLYPCLQSLQVDIQRVEWGIQLLALLKYTFFVDYLKACLELTLSWIVQSGLPF